MSARRPLVALLCLALLLGATAPTAVVGTAAAGERADTSVGTPRAADPVPPNGVGPAATVATAATVVQANNTTVRHRNPDRRDEEGDLAAVRDHLAGEMGEVIVDCSRAAAVGEFDPCEELNGSYGDSLSKYVEVSRETTDDGDDGTAREFGRARREGQQYARTVREFRENHEAYREARASGNASRARRKARELRALADEADRTGGNLTRTLRNVTRSGTDVSPASRAVNETLANVTATVEGIESDLFVETATTARLRSTSGSYLDPLVVTGRVTTANGTAVAGARVGLSRVRGGRVEDRVRARARTNGTGHYQLLYRPVTAPAGSFPVAVRLLPTAGSAYLPSNATVTPRIEQVRAELTVLSVPADASYGDRLEARVRVTAGRTAAGEVTVEGLPVTARLGGHGLGSDRTDGDGEAAPGGQLPAGVAPGERTLVVGFGGSDRAVAPVTESLEVDVRETATELSAAVQRTNGTSVVLGGTLATADGRRLAGRQVQVTVDGRRVGMLRTARNGSFRGNVTVPAELRPVEGPADRTVRLAFDGTGGNLASSETTVTVRLLAAAAPGTSLDGLWLPLAAVLLALVAGLALLGRRRWTDEGSTGTHGIGVDPGRGGPGGTVDPAAALEPIRAAMAAGDYDLVTTAGYRAVRRALADRVAAGPEATHWEFYGACAADGIDPERLEAFRGLTERFERVAFAPDEASQPVAAASLADAETVLGADDGDDGDDGDRDDHGADGGGGDNDDGDGSVGPDGSGGESTAAGAS